MYIVYSNNLVSGDVVARGPQYVHKDEAVANLIKEVQNYLLVYKRIENHKIVNQMNPDHIDPDIVWYIERPDDQEDKITLFRVKKEEIKGWWGVTQEVVIERHMIFSVMDLPSRPINIPQKKTYVIPDTPRTSKPGVSQDALMNALQAAVEKRRAALESD